jgi:hypothetical protein
VIGVGVLVTHRCIEFQQKTKTDEIEKIREEEGNLKVIKELLFSPHPLIVAFCIRNHLSKSFEQ